MWRMKMSPDIRFWLPLVYICAHTCKYTHTPQILTNLAGQEPESSVERAVLNQQSFQEV